MGAYRCGLCGGTITPNPDGITGICDYCKAKGPLPKDHSEEMQNLLNRANAYRRACNFDAAIDEYEKALALSSKEPEAHWGMLLSKYGVEYVQDKKTFMYSSDKLTLHRLSTVSVFDDVDYNQTIANGDLSANFSYHQKAQEIDDVLKATLIEVREQEPYDVFLCYKETIDGITRTEDSLFAHELYNELTGQGYNVFYAPRSLGAGVFESKIFAALVTARTMIVFGSKAEYFTSVWVKNEWKRFLEMINRGDDKEIIPVFRGKSSDILPVDLQLTNVLQANDKMIDFYPRLFAMLEKSHGSNHSGGKNEMPTTSQQLALDKLVQNAQTYLSLNMVDDAKSVYEKMTREFPEDYRGWWGLIVCETSAFTNRSADLKKTNVWFSHITKLADPKNYANLKKEYAAFLRGITMERAQHELQLAGNKTTKLEEMISRLRQEKEDLSQKTQKYTNLIDKGSDCLTTVSEKEQYYHNKADALWTLEFFIPIFLIGVMIVLLCFKVGWVSLLCLPVAILVFIVIDIIRLHVLKSAPTEDVEKIREALKKAEDELKQVRKRNSEINAELSGLIQSYEKYNAFVALGAERISDVLLGDLGRNSGLDIRDDQEAETLRNAVIKDIGSYEPSIAEDGFDSSVVCPKCKSTIRYNRQEALEKGWIVCASCNTTITVKRKK